MDPLTILGLGNAAAGLIGGLFGGGQKREAHRLLAGLHEPTYQIPQEVMENKAIAANRATSGLPSEQYLQAMKNIERTRNAAIRDAQDRRGGLASITAIQANTDDANLGLDAADAQQRVANEKQLMDANGNVAAYRDRQFQAKKSSYDDKYNYAMGLLGSGTQNTYNAVDKGFSGAALAAAGLFGNNKSY